MKNVKCSLLTISCSLIFFLAAHSQIFTEKGQEWGLDAIVTAHDWGSGVSTYDFNQDGFDDVTLVTDSGDILFYINVEGESFQLVDFGISSPAGFTKQVLWVDYDNDHDLDIFISSYFGKAQLYRNNGNFSFQDVTESAGLSNSTAPNYGVAFGDYDNDGDLDLHITRYYIETPPPESPDVLPNLWSRLYKNNGDGTFSDATIESNFYFNPVVAFQSVWFDLDNDNDQDNFIIVDRAPGNRFFKNENGNFDDVTDDFGVSYPGNDFMSNSIADYDNDGFLDIFMTNSGSIFANTPSVLLKNVEGENLLNVSVSVGLQIYNFGWGATWADVNNDGWKDLFFVTEEFEHNYFYLNDGGTFMAAHDLIETNDDYPCFAVGRGDFNNDGHYDLAVQGMSPNPSQLLMNSGSENNWIKVHLSGTISNSMAIGSTILAYVGEDLFMEYTFCGENYISQNSQYQILGVGEAEIVDSVTVTYLSGHRDIYYDQPVNNTYYFTEGESYSVQITASDTLICAGESIILNAGAHNEYLWSTGETSAEISVNSTGLYSVETTNEFGVTSSDSILVTVNPVPEIMVTTSSNPCNGDALATIQLNNNAGVDADSILWSSGFTGSFIDSLTAGQYAYQYFDVNGCTAEGSITITDPPVMAVFFESSPSDPDEANGSIFISIFGGIGPYTITLMGDTVDTEITNLAPGIYTVTVVDSFGCEKILEIEVESTLSANLNTIDGIKIYPSPVRDQLKISSPIEIQGVSVISLTGREVFQAKESFDSIDISAISSGVYIVIIKLGHSQYVRKRIVKV